MPDFTATLTRPWPYPAPSAARTRCRHPHVQFTGNLHKARRAEADRQFGEQYGHEAAIIHAASG